MNPQKNYFIVHNINNLPAQQGVSQCTSKTNSLSKINSILSNSNSKYYQATTADHHQVPGGCPALEASKKEP